MCLLTLRPADSRVSLTFASGPAHNGLCGSTAFRVIILINNTHAHACRASGGGTLSTCTRLTTAQTAAAQAAAQAHSHSTVTPCQRLEAAVAGAALPTPTAASAAAPRSATCRHMSRTLRPSMTCQQSQLHLRCSQVRNCGVRALSFGRLESSHSAALANNAHVHLAAAASHCRTLKPPPPLPMSMPCVHICRWPGHHIDTARR